MPFRFMDEITTADVAFEAWGSSREELFISSAAALLCTMSDAPERVEGRQEFTIRLEHEELDMLLFSFLQELIFYKDARLLLLHADRVLIEELEGGFLLEATVSGEQIDAGVVCSYAQADAADAVVLCVFSAVSASGEKRKI